MITITDEIRAAVARALAEDVGTGDLTANLTVAADAMAAGTFFARQDIVLAGVELLPVVFAIQGGADKLELLHATGDRLKKDTPIAHVAGRARTLLTCERVSLNFMQRLSGVATLASRYADAVKGTKCRILDTRKTTPGLRMLEKAAAAAGGVKNHRIGLFDGILIKNNHIAAAGGVRAALERTKDAPVPVEIEVRTREELHEALACGVKHLLLDNLTPAEAREWISIVNGRATCELSGGITLDTVRAYAEAGADFVSVGAITHSAVAVDLNFRLKLC